MPLLVVYSLVTLVMVMIYSYMATPPYSFMYRASHRTTSLVHQTLRDLMAKSGIIKFALLLEVWSNWEDYFDDKTPKPPIDDILSIDVESISKGLDYLTHSVLRPMVMAKPDEDIVTKEVHLLDEALDNERRTERLSILRHVVNVVIIWMCMGVGCGFGFILLGAFPGIVKRPHWVRVMKNVRGFVYRHVKRLDDSSLTALRKAVNSMSAFQGDQRIFLR